MNKRSDPKSDQAELDAMVERAMAEAGVAVAVEVYEKSEVIYSRISAASPPYELGTAASSTSLPRC